MIYSTLDIEKMNIEMKGKTVSKTLIEFFDKSPIENVVGTLLLNPDKVVYIGANKKQMKSQIQNYQTLFHERGILLEIECRVVGKHNLPQIQELLIDLVKENHHCAIDLTGGDELSLVAVGSVAKTLLDQGEKISFHSININSRKVIRFINEETETQDRDLFLTVPETIQLHGGAVIFEDNATSRWDWSEEFERDLSILWEICKENCSSWNLLISALSSYVTQDSLTVTVTGIRDEERPVSASGRPRWIMPWQWSRGFFRKLQKAKLIFEYENDDDGFSFTFKNEQIRRCLAKAGTVLELIVHQQMSQIAYKGGEKYFHDILSSVYIDWDGVIHGKEEPEKDTVNEIDVMAIKGLVPYFISCKNGEVTSDEFFKLNTVAERFGGKYARKIMVTTYMDKTAGGREHMIQRAHEMGLTLIHDVHTMDSSQLHKALKVACS